MLAFYSEHKTEHTVRIQKGKIMYDLGQMIEEDARVLSEMIKEINSEYKCFVSCYYTDRFSDKQIELKTNYYVTINYRNWTYRIKNIDDAIRFIKDAHCF